MRWLESITNLMDMNMSQLWELVMHREVWCAAIHGIFQAGVLEWGAIAFSGKIVQYLTSHRNTIVESLISLGFSSVTQSYLTLYNPMNCSMPGLPIHPQLLEFIRTHVH